MIVRIKLALKQEEYSGLMSLAITEMRNPEEQLRYILWNELKQRGLIPKELSLQNTVNNTVSPLAESNVKKSEPRTRL